MPFHETLVIRHSGVEVPLDNPTRWEKGDLLFFANDKGKGNVRHVGFYYGDGMLLHSPSTGKSVEVMKLEGSRLESELCAVRRYGFEEGNVMTESGFIVSERVETLF